MTDRLRRTRMGSGTAVTGVSIAWRGCSILWTAAARRVRRVVAFAHRGFLYDHGACGFWWRYPGRAPAAPTACERR